LHANQSTSRDDPRTGRDNAKLDAWPSEWPIAYRSPTSGIEIVNPGYRGLYSLLTEVSASSSSGNATLAFPFFFLFNFAADLGFRSSLMAVRATFISAFISASGDLTGLLFSLAGQLIRKI
jgi:hypothetical protein